MQVRRATAADIEAVFELADALALSGPVGRVAFEQQYARALADDKSVVLVAVDSGSDSYSGSDRIVGYLLGVVAPMFIYNGGLAFVQELFVIEQQRRRGVASVLMTEFGQRAAEMDASVIALATTRAAAFYEARGFTASATYFKRPLE
jgi:N-acetylglutamate synthase-like GNAT family acetyltransferase